MEGRLLGLMGGGEFWSSEGKLFLIGKVTLFILLGVVIPINGVGRGTCLMHLLLLLFACELWRGALGCRIVRMHLDGRLPICPSFIPNVHHTPSHNCSLAPTRARATLGGTLHCVPRRLRRILTPRFVRRLVAHNHVCKCHCQPRKSLGTGPISRCGKRYLRKGTFRIVVSGGLDFSVTLCPCRLIACNRAKRIYRG